MTAVGSDHALLAREVLAYATGGTLHVRGIDDDHPAPAGLGPDAAFYDDDGVPTFAATVDSPLARAARAGSDAILAVPADPRPTDAGSPDTDSRDTGSPDTAITQLVLGGQLDVLTEPAPVDDDGPVVVTVGLRVRTVVLERDTPESTTVAYRSVAPEAWAAARPDPLRPAAQRILAHTNGHHGAELRDWVAGMRGVPVTDVLAAELHVLDADGVTVGWLDERGAHRARVRFTRPAGCPGSLAVALRETLAHR